MEAESVILRIHEAIKDNKLEEALDLLERHASDSKIVQTVIALQRRLKEVGHLALNDLESEEQLRIERNRITADLLNVTQEINHTPQAEPVAATSNTISLIEEILSLLETTYRTYLAQRNIRNRLFEDMRNRFDVKRVENYYQVFSRYFDQMNEEELRYHRLIRGYTENIIKKNNFQILERLKHHPELCKAVPELLDLQAYLEIWKTKYESIFEGDPSINLVYIGVEEGVPFPSNIESNLRAYIENHQSA